MTREESRIYEDMKFNLLLSIEPFEEISQESVLSKLANIKVNKEAASIMKDALDILRYQTGKNPSIDERRTIQIDIYSSLKCNED